MARHKEFNQQEALSKAMETFWRFGYEGTSIQNLIESMGINRGSLYDTFGDKRSLFLAAIAHYDETVVQRLVSRLEDSHASKAAIIAYFDNLIERTVEDGTRRGCFLINTAVELCPHDLETQKRIAINLQRIEDAFYQALIRATQKREINQDKDCRALARYLTCLMQGIRVFSKINCDRDALKNIVETALVALN